MSTPAAIKPPSTNALAAVYGDIIPSPEFRRDPPDYFDCCFSGRRYPAVGDRKGDEAACLTLRSPTLVKQAQLGCFVILEQRHNYIDASSSAAGRLIVEPVPASGPGNDS